MLFTLFSDCQASAVRTFVSFLRTCPAAKVFAACSPVSSTTVCLLFYHQLSLFLHFQRWYTYLWSILHSIFPLRKSISVIQAAPLFLVWLATLHDQPQWQINMVPKSPSITQENITPVKNNLFHRQGIKPSLSCCYTLAWFHSWFSQRFWTSVDG